MSLLSARLLLSIMHFSHGAFISVLKAVEAAQGWGLHDGDIDFFLEEQFSILIVVFWGWLVRPSVHRSPHANDGERRLQTSGPGAGRKGPDR